MAYIAPMGQTSASLPKIVQKVKEKIYEDRDPVVLKCVVKLLQGKIVFKYIILIVFISLHIGGLVYSTQGKFRLIYDALRINRDIVKFVDTLSNILLTATNIFGFISFLQSADLYNLIFDVANKKSDPMELDKKRFQHCMTILHILTAASLFYILYVATFQVGWDIYKYYIARDIEFYCFNLIVYIVLCFVHKIKEIFQDVNQLLLAIEENFFIPDPSHVPNGTENNKIYFRKSPKYLERLKSITQYHNKICNLLDKYNDYFKAVLVLIVLCMIVNIIWDCTNLIEFAVKPRYVTGATMNVYASLLYSLLIVITAGQAALAALVGEQLAGEGQRTTVLCYSLLNKFPTHLETKDDQLIEKQVNLLLDQSRTRIVGLHAGGFFKIDWGILGSIASTVATYSIVVIQFLIK